MGQTRWYKKPTAEFTYAVALDPSMGTGGDYSAIQVFEPIKLHTSCRMATQPNSNTWTNVCLQIFVSILKAQPTHSKYLLEC